MSATCCLHSSDRADGFGQAFKLGSFDWGLIHPTPQESLVRGWARTKIIGSSFRKLWLLEEDIVFHIKAQTLNLPNSSVIASYVSFLDTLLFFYFFKDKKWYGDECE